ncbi:pilus assembly protein [Roseibacterium sp. SDUM158017]|uniref:TadE/TadG family type IV pilus assembly protein n=1 Tax=Roseicyclus salinarum TaxID=3036773 RepID=UPI0024154D25|nr:TadE family protein [Roseibacterium sp. SDUM158017]MDG4647347.1 pilus assembly protein [Roseibacterium sp. SDUM158017]
MTLRADMTRRARSFARDESGTTLVEFAIVFVIFLVLMFALVDFGRLAYRFVVADKAMQIASRVATVRPAACPGVPDLNSRGTSEADPPYRFGTSCRDADGICRDPGTFVCPGDATNATAVEVWTRVRPLLPADADIANLQFRYDYDRNLGFLGGPYTPIVTVELQGLDFEFIHPLGSLLALTGATATFADGLTIPFPTMSASLPGEDLAQGTNG